MSRDGSHSNVQSDLPLVPNKCRYGGAQRLLLTRDRLMLGCVVPYRRDLIGCKGRRRGWWCSDIICVNGKQIAGAG